MIINEPVALHTVEDWDIHFINGAVLSLPIDRDAGDSINYSLMPVSIVFYLAEKPSITDPDVKMPAEEVTIFMNHVTSITKRTRTVTPLSAEKQEEFKTILHKLSKTIQ